MEGNCKKREKKSYLSHDHISHIFENKICPNSLKCDLCGHDSSYFTKNLFLKKEIIHNCYENLCRYPGCFSAKLNQDFEILKSQKSRFWNTFVKAQNKDKDSKMNSSYFDLIDQTYYFPQESFDIEEDKLVFNGVPLMHLIEKYGSPLKITYLPRIGSQIKKARNLFKRAMKSTNYKGDYRYCFCTKSCHFHFVLNEVLKYGYLKIMTVLLKEKISLYFLYSGRLLWKEMGDKSLR